MLRQANEECVLWVPAGARHICVLPDFKKHFKELVPCHALRQTLGMHSFLPQISVMYPHFIDAATEAVTLTYLLPKTSELMLGAMIPPQATGRETIRLSFHRVSSIYGHFSSLPPTVHAL